jgi:hypothetical protein
MLDTASSNKKKLATPVPSSTTTLPFTLTQINNKKDKQHDKKI